MTNGPLVSVIMSVHNGERFLRESIESILNQTLSDFEFIIVDDGSTDTSCEIVCGYADKDSRIIAIVREQKGLTKSLNEALSVARGTFIARHDADDISLPERFSKMVSYLNANPNISAAGSWCEKIDDAGNTIGSVKFPIDHTRISWSMIAGTSIIHPSAVMRRECISKYGSYNEDYVYAQDYDLWTRWITLGARLANVPEILVKYRMSSSQISTKFFTPQSEIAVDIATAYVNFLLSDSLRPRQILGVRQLFGWSPMGDAAVCGIPVLLRLLRLPRFRPWIYYAWSTRSGLATNIASAIEQFGGTDRARNLSGLGVAGLISPRVMGKRNWWSGLRKQIANHHQ